MDIPEDSELKIVVSDAEVKENCGAIWFSDSSILAEVYELMDAPGPAARGLDWTLKFVVQWCRNLTSSSFAFIFSWA